MTSEVIPANVGAHEIWRLHQMGYLTAGGIAKRFDLCHLTAAYVVGVLRIPPDFTFHHRQGAYWSPESQDRIRRALIEKLEALA